MKNNLILIFYVIFALNSFSELYFSIGMNNGYPIDINIKKDQEGNKYIYTYYYTKNDLLNSTELSENNLTYVLQAAKDDYFIYSKKLDSLKNQASYEYHRVPSQRNGEDIYYYYDIETIYDNLINCTNNESDYEIVDYLLTNEKLRIYEKLGFENQQYLYNEDGFVVGYTDTEGKSVYPDGSLKFYNNEGQLIYMVQNGELKSDFIEIPEFINFKSLIQSLIIKIGGIIAIITGGLIVFLVVKKGVKWIKNNTGNTGYVGIKSEDDEKLKEEFYKKSPVFANKAQSWRNNTFSETMPFVKKDEYGGWYDFIHDEHYQENGFSEEYYLKMRRGTLYLKYMNMYSQSWEDYNNGLDVYSDEKKELFASGKIRELSENEFYKVLKNQNVNLATVADEEYLADIILTDTNELLQPVEENKSVPNGSVSLKLKTVESADKKSKRFTKSRKYSRKQYWAIRNYYRKRSNLNALTQQVVQPPPVPQQETVMPDDGYVSQEENRRLQMEWYEKNKAWINAHQSPVRQDNRSVADLIEERQKMKDELSNDDSPYFHSPISEP